MGWLGDFNYDRVEHLYYQRHKLSNGQFCMIGFRLEEEDYGKVENYYVIFAVANKKKHLNNYFNELKGTNITLKSTGTCGLEALIWAKNKILEFEDLMRREDYKIKLGISVNIYIAGEDNRRFRMYEKVFSKLGYTKVPGGIGDWPWYMRKQII